MTTKPKTNDTVIEGPYGEFVSVSDLQFTETDRAKAHDALMEIPAYENLVKNLHDAGVTDIS